MALLNQPDSPQPQRLHAAHLLVAEDDRVNQFYVVELVKWIGCTCDLAANGQEVLAAVTHTRYDAVLLDCHMPEMDGLSAARQIRGWEASGHLAGHLPLIALTALDDERDRCLAAGMDEYLIKPLDVSQLQAVIAKLLVQ